MTLRRTLPIDHATDLPHRAAHPRSHSTLPLPTTRRRLELRTRRVEHVLIADPSAPARSWLASALSRTGLPVVGAASGIEALELLSETSVCLMIASARLGEVPGHHLLAMLRGAGSQVPVVLIHPFPSASVRSIVERAAPAMILEDWTDTTALRGAAGYLLRDAGTPSASTG